MPLRATTSITWGIFEGIQAVRNVFIFIANNDKLILEINERL